MTQSEMVRKYIEDFGSITPAEAFVDLGVYRLSACIFKLRRNGLAISTEMEESTNRYGKTSRYARYRIAGRENV